MATNMRCPGCGSTRVIFESHKEGYDFKKGVAGAVLFGAVGAVAGVNGKKTVVSIVPPADKPSAGL